jgi:hydroxyacylglutathione hydrolase
MLQIDTLPLGPMGNLVYVIADSVTLEAAVIDPGWDVKAILDCVERRGYCLTKVLLTHAHYDHVNALLPLLSQHNLPVYVSAHETQTLMASIAQVPFIYTYDGDFIDLGSVKLQCIHTPGHTPGGQCFYSAPHLFTGDTLFVGACGRCDFEYSNLQKLSHSLSVVLAGLPDETVIYPGHDYGDSPTDTIGHQKRVNPYMKLESQW